MWIPVGDRSVIPSFDTISRAGGQLLDELTAIVSRAGAAILAFDPSSVARTAKADRSPVTAADQAAQEVIVGGLSSLLPGMPIVSEESAEDWDHVSPGASFVLVGPLDGTREFLAGRDEFTVNAALIADGVPTIGVIAAPGLALIWRGILGRASERLRLLPGAGPDESREQVAIHTRRRPASGLVALVSRSHFDTQSAAFLARIPVSRRIGCGSAMKFCRIAEGSADVYPRLAPTSEWDIAAGHAVLAAAGGTVTAPNGGPIIYGRATDGFRVPGFIACGDASAM